MRRGYMLLVLIMCGLVLGGCLNMGNPADKTQGENKNTKDNENDKQNAYEQENYVPIQEYTGEGFTLRDANPKTGEIAEANREEVVTAVEGFFKSKYKTEVNVHNIVSAVDGVSVFVESVGEPHFYSFAIVPIDIKNKEVKTDQVWSQEGQVEGALRGSLYVMAFEEEFAKLDDYLASVEERFPVVGMNIEVAENTQGNGYNTPYYFPKALFDPMYEFYLENPTITKGELRKFLDENDFNPAGMSRIAIRFHMEDPNVEPDEEIYDEVYAEVEALDGVPGGEYYFMLNDNNMDQSGAIGEKDNTIDKTLRSGIMKK